MSTPNALAPHFVVLAAIDESPAAELVIRQAAAYARSVPGAELHLLHIPDRFTNADVTTTSFDLGHGAEYIEESVRRACAESGVTTVGHLLDREPGRAIVDLAAVLDADLVVVGTRDRHGPARWILGSVAQSVMKNASCPVLVVRPKAHANDPVPAIEPPCTDCIREQRASNGKTLWCARHSAHHPRAHVHYEVAEGFGAGSSLIRG